MITFAKTKIMDFNRIKQFLGSTLFIALSFLLDACKPDVVTPTGDYEKGVFVVNEGVYSNTSGSISHYNTTTKEVENKIFNRVNNRDLGDVVQSMTFHKDRAYIVVNNSNKIEVADANTFEEKGQILGLALPRYFLPISEKQAYVSQWGSDGKTGSIAVLDLDSLKIIKTIVTNQQGSEQMLKWNDKVFVVNVGGFGTDNTLSVIDVNTNTVVKTIIVGDNPNSLIMDESNQLWVACGGYIDYSDANKSTKGSLLKIDPISYSITTIKESEKGEGIKNLQKYKQQLYYIEKGQLWSYDLVKKTSIVLLNEHFYGLAVANDLIYAATYSSVNNAWVKRYDLEAILIDSFQVGQFANSFVFK